MKILDCGIPLKIQKQYISNLKEIIERYNLCGYCPATENFSGNKKVSLYKNICDFCTFNTELSGRFLNGCPCHACGKSIAHRKAKKFIQEFEKQHGKI